MTQHLLENSLENAVLGRQRKSLIITESTKRLTSFHEAGHALVALHTPGTLTSFYSLSSPPPVSTD